MMDRGLKLQASSAFDAVLNAGLSQSRIVAPLTTAQQEQNTQIGAPGGEETTDLTQGSFGVSKLFRSGISVGETVVATRNVDNIQNPNGVNGLSPNVQVTVPLLRGRGRAAVAAQEAAAGMEVGASLFDTTNQITSLLTNAISDYWNLVADRKLVNIAIEAEGRAHTDLENTQTLVNADQLPRENLNEVNANLTQSEASRIVAEQTLLAAQYQLGSDIGMDEQTIASTTLLPSDDFPNPDDEQYSPLRSEALRSYVSLALQNRSDFLAAKARIEEQRVLVVAAKNHLQPQLNLTANAGYTGLKEGHSFQDVFAASTNNVDGPSASAAVAYNFAPRNDLARGAYIQALATQTQLEAQSAQLAHTISSAVSSAAQAVRNAALEVNKARAAATYYQQSLEGQREKYHLGIASVVDVLTVEERLTTAQTTLVQAKLRFAQALTQFRSATGTIVSPGNSVVTISADVFRTLPPLDHPILHP
jgi:outer membrane protein TolC